MTNVTITDQQGNPLEGVVVMLTGSPVSVPDIAAVTNERGVASLSHLTTTGACSLTLHHDGR